MEHYFEEFSRQRQITLDVSLAVSCACLASLSQLTELHLSAARTTLDDASLGAHRIAAAQSANEVSAAVAAGIVPQTERFALYCRALREIHRHTTRDALEILLRTNRMMR